MLIEAIRELDDRTVSKLQSLTSDNEIQLKSNSMKIKELKSDITSKEKDVNSKNNTNNIECTDLINIVEDMKIRINALDNIKIDILSKLDRIKSGG